MRQSETKKLIMIHICASHLINFYEFVVLAAAGLKSGQCGAGLCCKIKNECDVCNGVKDKPQKLVLRWVATSKQTITFSSASICVKESKLTSNSDSNEVVLDAAACFGSGSKLPTNIDLTVDGTRSTLHASCSQPLNLGDTIYKDSSKGFLILVGFRAESSRTHLACGSALSIPKCDV